jgi:hypothetical protein
MDMCCITAERGEFSKIDHGCYERDGEGNLIQVDIGGHPPFPTGPKHVSGNFGNLLFLAVFSGPELPGHFEALF